MRIAVLYTPKIWNIGNEFINQGAKILINECLKGREEVEVVELESLESGNLNLKYRTEFISSYGKAILQELKKDDLLIVIGGSCLSRYMAGMFEHLSEYGCRKILLGAGFYENIEVESFLYKDLPSKFEAIFVRDQKTYMALSNDGEFTNVYEGVDLAFWLNNDKKSILPKLSDYNPHYVVVNIDSPEVFELQKKNSMENMKMRFYLGTIQVK